MKALPPSLLALALGLVTGCQKEAITTYRIPKEQHPAAKAAPAAPPAPAGGDMANTAVATASGAPLTWTAPAAWTAKPAGAMRKGSYAVKGQEGEADFAITAFPGDVGGDLANLNRWRGQLSLPALAQADFAAATEHVDHNGLHMTVVDIVGAGDQPQRILGAMIPHGGATWFFKLTGPAALVAREKPAFNAFLATIKPAAPAK
ncbi:MAG: hypothetical protein ACO3JJ_10385 [Opitutaceae bacterium]